MSIEEPYPDLDELIADIGKAGRRISEIDASEGAAGNISIYVGWKIEPRRCFPKMEEIRLPAAASDIAGATFIVSGSGCRLRDILDEPAENLAVLVVNEDGQTARQYTTHRPAFKRVTSEFNSHFAVHLDQIRICQTNFHAVVHAQPLHITYLSHIRRYQDQETINRRLVRWQPELILNLPGGLGIVPFLVPGSEALMAATCEKLREHRVVVWCKHGLVARSEESTLRASDRIEYIETAARYEHLNLACGEPAEGLTDEELLWLEEIFHLD
jgi:rhamnulose-1-phosphate aldolase